MIYINFNCCWSTDRENPVCMTTLKNPGKIYMLSIT